MISDKELLAAAKIVSDYCKANTNCAVCPLCGICDIDLPEDWFEDEEDNK